MHIEGTRFESWPTHQGRLLCTAEQPKPADAPPVNWVHDAEIEVTDHASESRYERVRCPNCGSEWTQSKDR